MMQVHYAKWMGWTHFVMPVSGIYLATLCFFLDNARRDTAELTVKAARCRRLDVEDCIWGAGSRMRITPADIADLNTLIFAAALNPSRWQNFIDEFQNVNNGARPHIVGRDMATGRHFGRVTAGYERAYTVSYEDYYQQLNVWVDRFASSRSGSFMRTAEMYPLADLFRTEFYNDWVKPQDKIYGGGSLMLFNDNDRFLAFGGQIRERDIDVLDDGFEWLVRLLAPQVQQAFEINRALQGKAVAEFLANTDNQSELAILLVGSDGRVIFANHAAEKHLALGRIAQVGPLGHLASERDAIEAFFDSALRSLEKPGKILPGELHTLDDNVRTEILIRAARFIPDRQTQSPFGVLYSGDQRCVLFTIETKPVGVQSVTSVLRRHRLTRTEIEVALAIADTGSLAEIAGRRKVSINTVRNQRQAVLSKLNLRSQSQLIRMILNQGSLE